MLVIPIRTRGTKSIFLPAQAGVSCEISTLPLAPDDLPPCGGLEERVETRGSTPADRKVTEGGEQRFGRWFENSLGAGIPPSALPGISPSRGEIGQKPHTPISLFAEIRP